MTLPRPIQRSPADAAGPALIALASALLPGLGQLLVGRRRRGLLMIGVTVALLAVAGGFWFGNRLWVLTLSVRPAALLWLLVLNAAVLAFRAFAAVDAYVLARSRARRNRPTPALVGGALVLLLSGAIVVLPHAFTAYYDLIQYDLITTVFASGDDVVVTSTTTTTAAPPTTAPTTTGSGATAPSSTTSTTTTTTTIPPVVAPWDGVGRYNVLLMGSDAGVGRVGVRTDTMIVASIDIETGWMALFSVPRNLADMPLPLEADFFGCDCFPQIANELYAFGLDRPELFPPSANPGAQAVMTGIGALLDITIHNYALVDLASFVEVVDAIGGVTITVPQRLYDSAYPSEDGGVEVIDIPAGEQKMDGHLALAYVRSRQQSDDYSRIGRQRCMLEAIATGTDPARLLVSFPRLADILKKALLTDIPIDQLPDLVRVAAKMETDLIVSLRVIPPGYVAGYTADGYPQPNVPLIQDHVRIAMELPPQEAIELLGLSPLSEECG